MAKHSHHSIQWNVYRRHKKNVDENLYHQKRWWGLWVICNTSSKEIKCQKKSSLPSSIFNFFFIWLKHIQATNWQTYAPPYIPPKRWQELLWVDLETKTKNSQKNQFTFYHFHSFFNCILYTVDKSMNVYTTMNTTEKGDRNHHEWIKKQKIKKQ